MMTRAGKIMFGLHALVLIGTARAGAIAFHAGVWELAITLYAMAVIALVAIFREIDRAELHEAGRPLPYWLCWLKARHAASSINFCCNTYVNTVGARHDELCHQYSQSYLDEKEPGE